MYYFKRNTMRKSKQIWAPVPTNLEIIQGK